MCIRNGLHFLIYQALTTKIDELLRRKSKLTEVDPQTIGRASMLDVCVVHQYYGFSDEDIEAAIYRMQSACVFVCINR